MFRVPFFSAGARDGRETSRKQLRSDLFRSEARYRALFQAIDDGFCIIQFVDGPDGPLSDYVHIEANAGYERHTGIAGIVGKTVFDVAPNDGREWVKIYGEVLETGRPLRFERAFTEVGRYIEVSASRVEPASLNQVAVLFRDISGRKRAEVDLRASEKRARENEQRVQLALAAGAIVGTWVWDVSHDSFVVDDAFCDAMGLDPALDRLALTVDTIIANVHPDDTARLRTQIDTALQTGGPYAQQFRVRRLDGKFHWLEANGRVDLDRDGTAVTFPGVLIDISERRAVEAERDRVAAELVRLNETLEQRVAEQTAELVAKEDALRQSQKMEAIGQLTGGVAHDFNNLLAAISGSLGILRTRVAEGRLDALDRYITTAQTAAERAATLTQRLLAFSRRQSLAPRVTDLSELARGLHDIVERSVGPHIDIEMTAPADLWPSLVDRNQLENALLNLCINARDAMPSGGRLRVELENCRLDSAEAAARGLDAGDYVRIAVSDTGSGMSPGDIERAFDPFFTTKPLGEGTGLGLSMVYGFAQQTGGHASIRSQQGCGTIVELVLPRSLEPVDAAFTAGHSGSVAGVGLSGGSVLVVEDELLVRMVVVEALGDLGIQATEAGTGHEALEYLRSGARVDLLLTDVGLPKGMNGRQLAAAARELRPDLKILFVTGYDESAATGGEKPLGDIEVVEKPFDVNALMSKVRALLAD